MEVTGGSPGGRSSRKSTLKNFAGYASIDIDGRVDRPDGPRLVWVAPWLTAGRGGAVGASARRRGTRSYHPGPVAG